MQLEMPAILLSLDHALLAPWGVNNAQLLRDSEPMSLLETPRSLIENIFKKIIISFEAMLFKLPATQY